MALVINTNIASIDTQRYLTKTQNQLNTSLQRLSSGLRINSARDDAAGLAISSRLTSQVSGDNVAVRNANDGISLAQTAEGSLQEVTNNLQRIRELAVQSANATNSTTDRAALQTEASQLIDEINRVSTTASFNGVSLLDGSFTAKAFQVGANSGETITVASIADTRSAALGQHSLQGAGTVLGTVTTGSATNNGVTAVTAATAFTITTTAGTTSPITYAANAGADAIASAINSGASSIGITATATNSTTLSGLTGAGTVTFTLNGQNVSAAVTDQNDLSSVVSAINGVAGTTGVTASFTSTSAKNSITLTTTDGRNIGIGAFAVSGASNESVTFGGSTLTEGGTVAAVKTGTISLTSSQGAISTANASAEVFANAGVNNSSFSSLAAVDLSSASGASSALDTIDAALSTVNSTRAVLGAVQNRFSSVIASLQTTSENQSAALSRIQDADFAQETANYTKANVLQQAATSILSQANSNPQQVLSLLQRL